ncbi:HD-GYP domain, c-di-GMP phosphodiesterase class II (or its inactivated variant) [Methylomagnum ishizawai]|uniref:HD-GYP domain, c-di-GMP phosphodiesterase class II (Or its inactivated variant) n=1 Tax=Methylomagnum ishizawai TaxID=1760988 RepID=A0A1Y6CWW8_9GAMM|nr:HD-GYP domain-containing protein [Methylomagnum ishizawai]SMF94861.1 HD-GYP domain, c-di-GMP phosphodiesterase class II (or its inactivated variant) [Methylomagnum ishizawai]
MLKKIKIQDLRLGMYIQELCGSWMEHPFWKTSFKLERQKDLDTLLTCGIEELWIDAAKGLDVEARVETVSPEVQSAEVDTALRCAARVGQSKPISRVALRDELARAKQVHAKAKQAVVAMFTEARMGKAIKLEQAAALADEINATIARNSGALLSLVRLKHADDYTYLHSVAVCALMIALGRQLGLEGDLVREVGVAGLLHDVGKIFIPPEVLNKPGRLTDAEFETVKRHPRLGWELLRTTDGIREIALDVCLHHHERMDGRGYPDRLSGEALTLFARMGAVCDVYDAITSNRCYKAGWEPAEALRKMAEWRDGHFDPAVFQSFVKVVGIYPTGTLVKLKSGKLAVVVEQTPNNLLSPVVKIFFSTRSNSPLMQETVDLSKSQDAIASPEEPRKWGFDKDKLLGL